MYRKILRFSLVGAAATAVVFLWGPVLQAENMLLVAPPCPPSPPPKVTRLLPTARGVKRTVLKTFESPGIPGTSRTCWVKYEYQKGAQADFEEAAKNGDLCSITAGQLSVTLQGQKTVVYGVGDAFVAPPGSKGKVSNPGIVMAVEFCWAIEFK